MSCQWWPHGRSAWLRALPIIACVLSPSIAAADEPKGVPTPNTATEPLSDEELSDEELQELIAQGEVVEIVADTPPGSGHAVDAEELERFEHDDVHKVLSTVPGVYIREEDGYGLRPNIGMRGTSSERSAKITLMEDGIIIAPAPYAAPAAYYFPIITRMTQVEVLKGPASIQFGPNTVGGAINLISRPIPKERTISLDLAGGTNLYGKAHATYGQSWKHGGLLVEGVKLRTSGFKELDGGGNTGFDKNDVLVKGRVNSDPTAGGYHELNVKAGFSTESSNETYTGLSAGDFRDSPYRRYVATQQDRMTWDHLQLQATHRMEFAEHLASITTTMYRNTFTRDWRKLNGFNSNTALRDILANPERGNNAVFYGVLTGEFDSSSAAEALVIGTNARDFSARGIQSIGRLERKFWGATHNAEVGFRFHLDTVKRFHFEDRYLMVSGQLVDDNSETQVTQDSLAQAQALAFHVRDTATFGNLGVTGGTRFEVINTSFENQSEPVSGTQAVALPGLGITYQLIPELGFVMGVHSGFAPAAPSLNPKVDSERSVNYEVGSRVSALGITAETIGFFSNYSNLKGTCTFSSGCRDDQIGQDFDGGRVHVFGAEASGSARWKLGGYELPLRLSYTFNHARFQSSFASQNPQWGDVEKGDEPPYLPVHQLAVHGGLAGRFGGGQWEVIASGSYTSSMRDEAGQASGERTDSSTLVGLAASYAFPTWGAAYATANNIFDQANIVSLRPYGARPGAPRTIIVGYKNEM